MGCQIVPEFLHHDQLLGNRKLIKSWDGLFDQEVSLPVCLLPIKFPGSPTATADRPVGASAVCV